LARLLNVALIFNTAILSPCCLFAEAFVDIELSLYFYTKYMRKHYLFLFSILLTTTLYSQELKTRKEIGCNGLAKSAQEILAANKVLFVVSTTSNCSNCSEFADYMNSFATVQASRIVVWAAMNKLNGTTNCNEIDDFKEKYGFENIFAFIDTNDVWTDGRFTFYTVLDPLTGTIAYQGTSYQQAVAKALDIANAIQQANQNNMNPNALNNPTILAEPKINSVFPNPLKDELRYSVIVSDTMPVTVKVTDLLGTEKILLTRNAKPDVKEYSIDLREYHLEKGIYFVRLEVDKNVKTFRLVKN